MTDATKKIKPIVIVPIREKAEPEAWIITYMDKTVFGNIQKLEPKQVVLQTVKGRNTQEIDWKGHVEMKYGTFVSAYLERTESVG